LIFAKRTLAFLLFLGANTLFASQATYAESSRVSVLYPELRPPYRNIFEQMVRGLNSKNNSVNSYALHRMYDQKDLKKWLEGNRSTVVVALGERGYKAIVKADVNLPIVLGAVLTKPVKDKDISVFHSLAPSPKKYFSRLKSIVPSIEKVFVVYNPVKNKWLIDIASKEAAKFGLELLAYEADNLRNSAILHKNILKIASSENDALWLLQDSRVLDSANVLPMILKESWDKNLVVFSGSLSHVDKGVLFGLYPDNYEVGATLIEVAIEISAGTYNGDEDLVLEDVKSALNIRTANHLGLSLSGRSQGQFDLIFPRR